LILTAAVPIFKAHRRFYQSTLCSRDTRKKKKGVKVSMGECFECSGLMVYRVGFGIQGFGLGVLGFWDATVEQEREEYGALGEGFQCRGRAQLHI
jgi:hypothetical protein